MNNIIQYDEILYRVIKCSRLDAIKKNGRPSSALFKEEGGVSVDRDGGRTEGTIIDSLKNKFDGRFKGLAKVNASVCVDNKMFVVSSPSFDDKYHAEIFENSNKDPISKKSAVILARNSKIIDLEKDIEWTNFK